MKQVTISTTNDTRMTLNGEPMLDTAEDTLVIACPHGSYALFNFKHVEFFVVTDPEVDHDDDN